MRNVILAGLALLTQLAPAQTPTLTVDKIMQDPKSWIGTSPSNPFWSEDGNTIYFNWNPDRAPGDSLYKINVVGNRTPQKVSLAEKQTLPPAEAGTYNRARTQRLYEKWGDLYWLDVKTGNRRRLTNTVERESTPTFSQNEQHVVFVRNSNLYRLALATGEVEQLTNIDFGSKKPDRDAGLAKPNEQEAWLKRDQLALFEVLRERKAKKDAGDQYNKAEKPRQPKAFYTDGRAVLNPTLSPDGRYVTFTLAKPAPGAKPTIVPNYVTESGFTEDIPARTKVGAPLPANEFYVYDLGRDTALAVSTRSIPGIQDVAAFRKDYSGKDTSHTRRPPLRSVYVNGPTWSPGGTHAVVVIRAIDNKDRWLMLLDPATRGLKLLDRQHDDAWIGGPGIGFTTSAGTLGWVNDQTLYFQSEADGFSHLYTLNVLTGEKKQLTKGRFEVQQVQLSRSKTHFFITTNEAHPGEQHLYRMAVSGGERTRLTPLPGANDATLSPDESRMVIRQSYSNRPWELYYVALTTDRRGNGVASEPVRLTQSTTAEFRAYPWRDPNVVTIPARDGQTIYARLYKPTNATGASTPGASTPGVATLGRAVVFVHGAGYLQNAHKWWSQYFREYQFHNLLADRGYTVLDIDYRASAGYGRDWRTGIYRHMGGKDLTDHLDAADWLVKNHGVDAARIGIYGGSYGGFITLMAMFTSPTTFRAGAALRPVTDWAAYNHGYTSNILNEPFTDSLAYRRSSPIYFADGLKGHLLICHGMVDVNVHFQDVVRLTQRLIELRKENWELAVYPVEDHAFTEPSSWADEYKRILKLFDERL